MENSADNSPGMWVSIIPFHWYKTNSEIIWTLFENDEDMTHFYHSINFSASSKDKAIANETYFILFAFETSVETD